MTPEKLARIQTHLDNEAAGTHPQEVADAVLWGLIEDAESPPGKCRKHVGQTFVCHTPASHTPDGDVFPTDKVPLPRAPGVVATDGRAPGGGEPQRTDYPLEDDNRPPSAELCRFVEHTREWRDKSSRSPVCLFGPGGEYQTPWPAESK